MSPWFEQKHRFRAFTLVELMVTIGVIIILGSLLVTTIASAKNKAHMAQCAHNLKQHGVALHSFLATHSVYPLHSNPGSTAGVHPDHEPIIWKTLQKHGLGRNTLSDGTVHACPAASRQKVPQNGLTRTIVGYGDNRHGLGKYLEDEPLGLAGMTRVGQWFVSPVPESAVVNPAEMIAWGDAIRGWNKTYEDGRLAVSRSPDAKEYAGSITRVPERHNNRLVILFADGHVESLSLKRLFEDQSDEALRIWNRDNQPHPERLN